MDTNQFADQAALLAQQAATLQHELAALAQEAARGVAPAVASGEPFVALLAIFLLACFVGYYVVWNVTPALHSPLMGVTNAISSVIIVGAMLAVGLGGGGLATVCGFFAVLLASINIFGGFTVTARMLGMFRQRKPGPKPTHGGR
jgi:NAD(P) transhydrogenase subunit alpha